MNFSGVVSAGDGRGRAIGFPTANLRVMAPQDLPRGVFAGWARWDREPECAVVVNIGQRPTFADRGSLTVEVHVLEFDGDSYGKTVTVRLGEKIREEQRFDSVQALAEQIAKDVQRARTTDGSGA